MQVVDGAIDGLKVITLSPFRDQRGFFVRNFDNKLYADIGINPDAFVQENGSRSCGGAVRGLHFRTDGSEAKLVRCSAGAVYDVAVDLRPWSPTFGKVHAEILDTVSFKQMYVPAGCAHGFQALVDSSDVQYKVTSYYKPDNEMSLRWDDPELGIDWPHPELAVVSDKDGAAPTFAMIQEKLQFWFEQIRPD